MSYYKRQGYKLQKNVSEKKKKSSRVLKAWVNDLTNLKRNCPSYKNEIENLQLQNNFQTRLNIKHTHSIHTHTHTS